MTYRIKGNHARTGMPMWRDITSDEILEALLTPALKITRTVNNVLEDIMPDMLTDVMEDGITLAGASARIYGMDRLLSRKTEMQVQIAEDPEFSAVRGAGEAIRFVKDMDNGAFGVINPLHKAFEA